MWNMSSLPVDLPALAFLALVAALSGLARGFSGFGAALVFVPLASTAVPPTVAVPLLLVMDALLAWGFIPKAVRLANHRDVGLMTLGALAGIPAGVYLLSSLDPLTIRWSIVAIVVLLLALLTSRWRYDGEPASPLTVLVGAVSGVLAGAAQIGGPPVVAYWLGGRSSASVVRANIILFFAISTVLSAISYIWGGLITVHVLMLAVLLALFYGAGLWLGSRMFGLANERTFRRICLAMIAVSALISMPILDGLLRPQAGPEIGAAPADVSIMKR
jgi:uncharacterized membrane protein YfcA